MAKTISSEKKDELFRHPESGTLHFGRHFSLCGNAEEFWAAVQMGEGRETRIALTHARAGAEPELGEGAAGKVHRPVVTRSPEGRVGLVWDEPVDGGWEIRHAAVDPTTNAIGPSATVRASGELCLPPAAAFLEGVLHVAWPERSGGALRIHASRLKGDVWTDPEVLSEAEVDAFRPHMAADGGVLALVWDEYRDGRYQIAAASASGDGWKTGFRAGAEGERWLTPRVSVGPGGETYLTWVALKPVTDKLGIIDHWPMGMAGRLDVSGITLLTDSGHPSDERVIADLRDGLLASKIYKGYVGLRRNPFPAVDDRGRFWCFWELRTETTGSTVAGPFLGRRLREDGEWTRPSVLSRAGYGYAVPGRFDGQSLPLACMRFDRREREVLHVETVAPESEEIAVFEESRWRRWRSGVCQPEAPVARTIVDGGKTYHLYWADTHVHSAFSPDAEGEPDELAHFARDQAGLNLFTAIDNDFYPHKALTEPEWRIHQALAAHFTKGDFRWMPGYEFTNHRSDLQPDFNHRTVLYPSGNGVLHRRIDPDTQVDTKMIPALAEAGAMPYPHHCTYDIIDNGVEWNVEVTSSWRVCIEETDFTIRELLAGRRLGFIGSSDTHRAIPGLGGARTGVLATDLSPESIRDAYKNRRLIATQGHNIFVDFKVAGTLTGGETEISEAPLVELEVEAPEALDYIEIVCDGEVVYWEQPEGKNRKLVWRDDRAAPGRHFYYPRIKMVGDPSFNRDGYDSATNNPTPFSQDSRYPHNLARARGPFAWASPVWVRVGQ